VEKEKARNPLKGKKKEVAISIKTRCALPSYQRKPGYDGKRGKRIMMSRGGGGRVKVRMGKQFFQTQGGNDASIEKKKYG